MRASGDFPPAIMLRSGLRSKLSADPLSGVVGGAEVRLRAAFAPARDPL